MNAGLALTINIPIASVLHMLAANTTAGDDGRVGWQCQSGLLQSFACGEQRKLSVAVSQ